MDENININSSLLWSKILIHVVVNSTLTRKHTKYCPKTRFLKKLYNIAQYQNMYLKKNPNRCPVNIHTNRMINDPTTIINAGTIVQNLYQDSVNNNAAIHLTKFNINIMHINSIGPFSWQFQNTFEIKLPGNYWIRFHINVTVWKDTNH